MLNSNLKWDCNKESEIFDNADPKLITRFREFHEKHPEVYFMFFQRSVEIMTRGFKKYSAQTILYTIRWENDLKSSGEEAFKINNDYIALYSRLLIYHHPIIFEGFFEQREMKPSRRQVSDLQRERELVIAAGE